jgi:hypothetical protein
MLRFMAGGVADLEGLCDQVQSPTTNVNELANWSGQQPS